jgi:hypothetical protein
MKDLLEIPIDFFKSNVLADSILGLEKMSRTAGGNRLA